MIGTSNKTELLLGYGTLYGDMASAINPLGDLYKTQVWALSEAIGVPQEIVFKEPSADLWAARPTRANWASPTAKSTSCSTSWSISATPTPELAAAGFSRTLYRRHRRAHHEFPVQTAPAGDRQSVATHHRPRLSLLAGLGEVTMDNGKWKMENCAILYLRCSIIDPLGWIEWPASSTSSPTPIGNLEDITLRALRVLKEVELIAAEDTRHTQHLLAHFGIKTALTSYHEHNERDKARTLVERLKSGASIALVTDAGTPAISDPVTVSSSKRLPLGFKWSRCPAHRR